MRSVFPRPALRLPAAGVGPVAAFGIGLLLPLPPVRRLLLDRAIVPGISIGHCCDPLQRLFRQPHIRRPPFDSTSSRPLIAFVVPRRDGSRPTRRPVVWLSPCAGRLGVTETSRPMGPIPPPIRPLSRTARRRG